MSAIGTMTGGRSGYAGSRSDLEVAETFFDRALTAEIAVLVLIDRDADLVAETFQIPSAEAHGNIHAAILRIVNRVGFLRGAIYSALRASS